MDYVVGKIMANFHEGPQQLPTKIMKTSLRAMNHSFMEFYSWPTVRLPSVTWPSTCFLLGELNVPTKKMLRLGEFAQKMSTCKKNHSGSFLPWTHTHSLVESQRPIRWARTFWTLRALTSGRCFMDFCCWPPGSRKGNFLSKLSYHILPVFWILIG